MSQDSKAKFLGTIIILISLIVTPSCKEGENPVTSLSQAQPGDPVAGDVLPIQLAFGSGDALENGIKLSNTKFTYDILTMDYAMPYRIYKKGEPAIFFSGTLTNERAKDWYTGFSTVEVVTLASYGILGVSVFLPAGTSHFFNVPLSYKKDLITVTVNIGVADIPWP